MKIYNVKEYRLELQLDHKQLYPIVSHLYRVIRKQCGNFSKMYFKLNKLLKDPCHLFCIIHFQIFFEKFHEICAMGDFLVTTTPS